MNAPLYSIDREYFEVSGKELPGPITPFAPYEITCKHPNVTVDHISREFFCEDCDIILGYYDNPSEELLSSHLCQSFIIKPKANGVQKTFNDLRLELTPPILRAIESNFKEVTEGKVKKGKPRRSILAVCYIVAMSSKLSKLSDVLDTFKIDMQSFVVGLRSYESKFGPVDFTHMEVPKGFLSTSK